MTARREPLPEFKREHRELATLLRELREMRRVLELRLAALEKPAQVGYTISNGVENRTLDVSTADAAGIAEFLGTLVTDLKSAGKLG